MQFEELSTELLEQIGEVIVLNYEKYSKIDLKNLVASTKTGMDFLRILEEKGIPKDIIKLFDPLIVSAALLNWPNAEMEGLGKLSELLDIMELRDDLSKIESGIALPYLEKSYPCAQVIEDDRRYDCRIIGRAFLVSYEKVNENAEFLDQQIIQQELSRKEPRALDN